MPILKLSATPTDALSGVNFQDLSQISTSPGLQYMQNPDGTISAILNGQIIGYTTLNQFNADNAEMAAEVAAEAAAQQAAAQQVQTVQEPVSSPDPVASDSPIEETANELEEVYPFDGLVTDTSEAEKEAALQDQMAQVQSTDASVSQMSSINLQDNASVAAALGVSEQQLDAIKATIRNEAGNNVAEIANVASCIKNRMNSGNWGGTNAFSVVSASGQFQSYYGGGYKEFTGGNYYQGDASSLASVNSTINGILLGSIPTTHNYQSFRGKNNTGSGRVQLVEGGNNYF